MKCYLLSVLSSCEMSEILGKWHLYCTRCLQMKAICVRGTVIRSIWQGLCCPGRFSGGKKASEFYLSCVWKRDELFKLQCGSTFQQNRPITQPKWKANSNSNLVIDGIKNGRRILRVWQLKVHGHFQKQWSINGSNKQQEEAANISLNKIQMYLNCNPTKRS